MCEETILDPCCRTVFPAPSPIVSVFFFNFSSSFYIVLILFVNLVIITSCDLSLGLLI